MNGTPEPTFDASARSVTMLLNDVNGGGKAAFERLIVAVYDDMRRVAAGRMKREFRQSLPALTESPTGIVHQAVLKLR